MGNVERKHFDYGKWRRAQLYAIVAHYWRQQRTPEWVATKLGIGLPLTEQIYDYLIANAPDDELPSDPA